MSTDIVAWKPILVVELFDGELFFLSITEGVRLNLDLESKRFVRLNGKTVNVSTIKKVYVDEYGLAGMNEDQYRKLKRRVESFEKNIGREPTDTERIQMINKIKSDKPYIPRSERSPNGPSFDRSPLNDTT